MHKPPIAPKPKLVQPQRPLPSPSTPRTDGLSLPSPSTQRRVKPVLAPKPCLSKLSPALETKPLASQTLRQPPHGETQRAVGPLYPQRDGPRESKKPDWDYIIPICLCSNENCTCIRNTSVNPHKAEKDLNVLHKFNSKTEEKAQLFPKSQKTFDNKTVSRKLHKPLQETFKVERNLNAEHRNGTVRPPVPQRTWSDEANGEVEPQDEPGRGSEEDVLGAEQVSRPEPPPAGPTKPIPVPRKLRTAELTPQERVEEEGEEIPGWDGAEMNVKEVKVLLEGKSISSPSAGAPAEKQPAIVSAGKACAIPDPPPRKKPLLSVPEKTSTPAPRTSPKDVVEEDLGWDGSSQQMQVSLDKGGKVTEEKERDGERDGEMVYPEITHKLTGSHNPPVAAEAALVKEGPKKPQLASSPMAWTSSNESSAENQEKVRYREKRQSPADGVLKADEGRTFLTPAPVKPCQPSLSKHKSKSFSAADLVRSEGQRRTSFRKLLDLKLKMMPKLKPKADQLPGRAAPHPEQSVDGKCFSCDQKLPCPVVEVEQCVDREEDLYYENISHYEEIADYINMEVSLAGRAALSPSGNGSLQPPAWQSPAYDDEGIYEEPDPYISFEKNEQQRCPTPSDCDR